MEGFQGVRPFQLHQKCFISVQSTQPGGKFCLQNRYNQDDSQTSFSVQFLACGHRMATTPVSVALVAATRAGASKTAPDPPPGPLLKNKPQPSSAVDRQRGHCAGGEDPAARERLVTEAH
jgi:hypothetical protein